MTRPRSCSRLACALLLAAVAHAGCSRDPEASARRDAASGDAYVARKQYDEAIIEYRKALKATPHVAALHHKLGLAYEESGDPARAYAEFTRAADLDPTNLDAQIRAGTLLLVNREFEQARVRAQLAIDADPSHAPAHILLGNALAGLNETGPALEQIEQAIALDPSNAPAWTALGAVNFMGGRRTEAAEAFRKAVALAPSSADVQLALANFQWASGDARAAEGTLKRALELEPENTSTHRALALLYLTTRRSADAETHFKALATDSAGRLALADYYLGTGRNKDALAVLDELERSSDKDASGAARLRKAALFHGDGRKDEAYGLLNVLIAERPRNAEARITKARLLLTDGGAADEALAEAREAVKADPTLPAAHYTVGLAALATKDLTAAERAFDEVTRISPRAAAAQYQLARLRLARGDSGRAVSAAEQAAKDRPDDAQVAVLLSQGLRAQGDLERAGRELNTRLVRQPDSVPLHLEMGSLALQRRDAAAARKSFNEALRAAPDLFEARSGLVAADLLEGKAAAARARISQWQKSGSADPALQVLAARVELAAGDMPAAQAMLERVIAADASQLEAYELLGRAYASQGRVDDAIVQYEALAGRSPGAVAGAKTMVGMLQEARKDQAAAQSAYEQALAADARAGVAANNLSWMYAGSGRLDDALRLATVARESLQGRPEAEDTLGWAYLQKGLAAQALASFERARERAPKNPVYHYHVGLAYLKLGDDERAGVALSKALELRPDFAGAADARAQLAALPSSTAK